MKKDMPIYKIVFSLMLLIGLLTGCVTQAPVTGTASLEELQDLNGVEITAHSHIAPTSHIRYTVIKDTALTIGAQAGLGWRASQINEKLEAEDRKLREAYNFYGMVLDHDVIPPVLVEGDNTLNLADPQTIRLSQKVYKIAVQAHFVTAPPNWRDYLWMNFPVPDVPDNSLLPVNPQEKQIWNYYVEVGWKNGLAQADNIFSANLARLDRDYKGMSLYLKLYAENMVSAPFVAQINLGITGDGAQMSINDRVLRITALPQLNLQGSTWKPGLIPTPKSLTPEGEECPGPCRPEPPPVAQLDQPNQ